MKSPPKYPKYERPPKVQLLDDWTYIIGILIAGWYLFYAVLWW
jgi:hypothetical protein